MEVAGYEVPFESFDKRVHGIVKSLFLCQIRSLSVSEHRKCETIAAVFGVQSPFGEGCLNSPVGGNASRRALVWPGQ